jgi:hypothetical protein
MRHLFKIVGVVAIVVLTFSAVAKSSAQTIPAQRAFLETALSL